MLLSHLATQDWIHLRLPSFRRIEEIYDALAARLLPTSAMESNLESKYIVGLAGPPGAGKSTVASEVARRLNKQWPQKASGIDSLDPPDLAIVLPMDGFHLYRHQLDEMENPEEAHARRGAPWTFDPVQLLKCLKTLRSQGSVYAPSFDHGVGDPVEDDIFVSLHEMQEMIRELAQTQTSESIEDLLLNDPLTQVFGKDDRGRMRAIGTTVSRTQVQGAIPVISKMTKKAIQHDAQSEKMRKEWEKYKEHLDQSMGEIRAMCQTILNNQTNIIQTQSTPATQQLGRESTRRERKCNLIDWRRNIVATGRVIEMEGQTVHGIPLSDEDCRVILDAINQPNTPLSISTSFAETLGDVGVGGHTTWPKAFIKFL